MLKRKDAMRVKLDIPLTVEEICSIANGNPGELTNLNEYIQAICTDTRECKHKDLFIAIDGENESGEKYVGEAISKKCHVISTAKLPKVIHVDNTAEALLKIAELYKSKINVKHTIAITGSLGKSTTVKFVAKILSKKYKVHSPIGNFNNHLGVPLTILNAPRNTELLVLELGMNHKA